MTMLSVFEILLFWSPSIFCYNWNEQTFSTALHCFIVSVNILFYLIYPNLKYWEFDTCLLIIGDHFLTIITKLTDVQVFISDYFFKSDLAKDFSYADIEVSVYYLFYYLSERALIYERVSSASNECCNRKVCIFFILPKLFHVMVVVW